FLNPIMNWDQGFNQIMSNLLVCAMTASFTGPHIVLYLVSKQFPPLLETLATVSRRITDPTEQKIMSDYADSGRRMTETLITLSLVFTLPTFAFPFISMVIDMISPLEDGSRRIFIMVPMEFIFFKLEDHYISSSWLISCAGMSNFMSGALICCIYILTMRQTSGLFSVTCSRLNNILVGDRSSQEMTQADYGKCRKNLQDVVSLHAEAIRVTDQLEDTFNLIVLSFQIPAVIMLSLSYYYIAKVRGVPLCRHYIEVVLIAGFNAFLLCYNALGQEIIDISTEVYYSACSCEWIALPIRERKYMLLIVQRALNPVQLTAGKVSILSYETFAKVTKASLSYFTILKSLT
ncbi:hypothetical protein QAD02_016179, partial [Eretmocerus hayati]